MLLVSLISLPTHLPRVRVVAPAAALRATVPAASEGEATIAAATRIGSYPPPKDSDYIDRLCRGANGLFARTNFIPAVAEYVRLREEDGPQPLLPCASDALQSAEVRRALWERLTSPPCTPGLSRPVWLVIAASVPTALGWYGYYKFSIEEELFHDELRRSGRATGCGGYGTLFPFVWSFLIGGVGLLAGLPGADLLVDAGALWILLGQVNLYRRVNELHGESGPLWTKDEALLEPPVYAWWALLPPPLDVVVGLRQVHFLARHWAAVRGEPWQGDPVAEEFFPFISAPRFTLRQFARTPALWFQFTADWEELDWPLLQDPSEGAPWRSPFEWGFLWGGAPADPAPKSIGLAPADLAAALARDLSEGRYILTGNLTSSLFADDCRFVDPNNAVDGLSRYRQALGFLFEPTRSQLDNVHVRVVAAGSGRATIEATYVASGELKLPWRPKISPWSGKISYDVSPVTGLVVAQTDVWNITRFDAIRQTFTPGSTSRR